jgi:hypothetical protein
LCAGDFENAKQPTFYVEPYFSHARASSAGGKIKTAQRFALSCISAEREALEPTYSRNIIKLQIINNQALFGVHSKSKSF